MVVHEKRLMTIPVGNIQLKGDLVIPEPAHGLVLFAHGSGSSRLSPRNQMVSGFLNQMGLGTLLFDLLTYQEDQAYRTRFNISLLSERLFEVTLWAEKQEWGQSKHLGYFGASTGAAAALTAASWIPRISAVVSRGGRPDLALPLLPEVQAATLLIVGSLDKEVQLLNEKALRQLRCEKRLEIVNGASHLFEEKGTMEKVCVLAGEWFETHLQPLKLSNH